MKYAACRSKYLTKKAQRRRWTPHYAAVPVDKVCEKIVLKKVAPRYGIETRDQLSHVIDIDGVA